MTTLDLPFKNQIAQGLKLPPGGVAAVLLLVAEGATVPFIARYRKERTGSLDEVQIRAISERATYLQELNDRRQSVLAAIEEQGQLTEALKKRILNASSKTDLEDLYLPYKKKRRTKAAIAKERGLEPLADLVATQPAAGTPTEAAALFVDAKKDVPDAESALAGARDILIERLVENADARLRVRGALATRGLLAAEFTSAHKKSGQRTKFDDFKEFSEPLKSIPSHRFLAVRRGQNEGVLRTKVHADLDDFPAYLEQEAGTVPASAFASVLQRVAKDALLRLRIYAETDVILETKQRADLEAVAVFAGNLKDLLLAAPLGPKAVIGIDPGIRTGCKVAVVDETGRYLETTTLYLSQGTGKKAEAAAHILALVQRHRPLAIAVGNGTYGRETEGWLRPLIASIDDKALRPFVVSVNEAGASVYSASDIARAEFPDLDLTIRGAISIARRLQDPLAELVKTDPKSIGVGQYQHDVYQRLLSKKLDEVVEDCVNQVGVEINTASAPLLARVAGISSALATRIVAHREEKGAFATRKQLLKVKGLGAKAFEQSAGFLRVRESKNPLDRSAVHPERYDLVAQMAKDASLDLEALVGSAVATQIDIKRYLSADVGEPTLQDIVAELQRPGRDPRQSFSPPKFRDDVNTMGDLEVGMKLDGVVTNVTAFGAFVDVGVHQDGLVHISQLADRFVKDPRDVVRSGDRLRVVVLEIDLERKRIALSARSQPEAKPSPTRAQTTDRQKTQTTDRQKAQATAPGHDRAASKKNSGRAQSQRGAGTHNERKQTSSSPRAKPDSVKLTHNPFAQLGDRDR